MTEGGRFAPNDCARAFMRTAQYMASMLRGAKVLEEARQVVQTAFAADTVAFLPHGLADDLAGLGELAADVRATILVMVGQVRDSGFMTTETTSDPHDAVWIALPVTVRGREEAMMLVGYSGEREPPPHHLLEAMLGVAALVSSALERELTDLELQDAANNRRLILDAGGNGICSVDGDGIITFANKTALDILGCTEQQLIGLPAVDVVADKGSRGNALDADKVRREVVLRRRDGTMFPAELVCVQMVSKGQAAGLVATFADISERKAKEAHLRSLTDDLAARLRENEDLVVRVRERTRALAEAEAQFRAVFDSQFQFVTLLAPDGTTLLMNHTALTVGGLTSADVIGCPFWETGFWPEAERAQLRADIASAAGGALVRREVEVKGGDGRSLWIDFSLKSIADPATGRVESIIAEGRDLTERRMAEQLERARDKAERATRAKSSFLSGMSHELRTPLNGILGYAELLRREGGLNVAQVARVEAMLGAGTHLLQVINRVLDLAEIETGHVDVQTSDADLPRIARTCLDLVRPTAAAKSLALNLVIDPDVPCHVMTDPTRLRQVLLNLLGNAVKFTAQGTVELRLRTTAHGAGLRLEVADTGPGIPAEQCHRLFQEFERLDAGTEGKVEGAGLGLALSARLAVLMGGRLGHDDNPGGGSVFWLALPAVVPRAASPFTPEASNGRPTPAHSSALRVLVVDDNAMNRDIAGSFIHAAGHHVVCAEGGAEAVTAAATSDFDVVLMDVRMPRMDGLEATRRIRALEGWRGQVPIVALTAQAFTEQVDECRRAGMNGHLTKPYTPDALLAAVARAAAGRTRGQGNRGLPEVLPPAAVASSEGAGRASLPTPAGGCEPQILDQKAFDRNTALLPPKAVVTYLKAITERSEDLLCALRGQGTLARAGGGLADAAHSLAGSAGMFGFDRLAATARSFQRAVQTNAAETPAHVASLSAALEESLAEMYRHTPT